MGVKRPGTDLIAMSLELPEALTSPLLAQRLPEHVPAAALATRTVRRGKAEMRCSVRVAYLSDWLTPSGSAEEGDV